MRVCIFLGCHKWDFLSTNVQMGLLQHQVTNCLICHSGCGSIRIRGKVHCTSLLPLRLTTICSSHVQIHSHRTRRICFCWANTSAHFFICQLSVAPASVNQCCTTVTVALNFHIKIHVSSFCRLLGIIDILTPCGIVRAPDVGSIERQARITNMAVGCHC